MITLMQLALIGVVGPYAVLALLCLWNRRKGADRHAWRLGKFAQRRAR
jgi:hypothetical protein